MNDPVVEGHWAAAAWARGQTFLTREKPFTVPARCHAGVSRSTRVPQEPTRCHANVSRSTRVPHGPARCHTNVSRSTRVPHEPTHCHTNISCELLEIHCGELVETPVIGMSEQWFHRETEILDTFLRCRYPIKSVYSL